MNLPSTRIQKCSSDIERSPIEKKLTEEIRLHLRFYDRKSRLHDFTMKNFDFVSMLQFGKVWIFLFLLLSTNLVPIRNAWELDFLQYNWLGKMTNWAIIDRMVATYTLGPGFEFSHQQLLLGIYFMLTVCWKDEN